MDEGFYGNEINDVFRRHFRMRRDTFFMIVDRLRNYPDYSGAEIQIERQVAVALYRLANGTSIRLLAQMFGISEGSVSEFTDRFLFAVAEIFKNKITWPRGAEVERVCNGFANSRPQGARGRLLRCIGAIDGTLIKILTPVDNPDRYRSRKKFCALNVLAVCDHRRRFTYVYIGPTGRVHDTGALKMSRLWSAAQDPQRYQDYFPSDTYLIGDSGFGNYKWLLAAFKPSHIRNNRERKRFNKVQSSTRMAIERAFGQLKGRWRILLEAIRSHDIQRICQIIHVCCILHNICIDQVEEDCEEQQYVLDGDDVMDDGNVHDRNENLCRRDQVVQELAMMY